MRFYLFTCCARDDREQMTDDRRPSASPSRLAAHCRLSTVDCRLFSLPLVLLLALLSGCVRQPFYDLPKTLGLPPNTERTLTDTQVTLRGGGHTFTFDRGKRTALLDGARYYLHEPAGMNTLGAKDTALIRQAIVRPAPTPARATLLLDPGHGASDTGCRVGKTYEKNITLAVALEVKRLLEAQGHRVLMTRSADGPQRSLDERAQMGATNAIDAFVSIHVNSAANAAARGIEVYTLPAPGCEGTAANSPARAPMVGQAHLPAATRLAFCVQQALLSMEPPAPADRGLRHAHFKVLRDTPAPAILIEMGFLTNAQDFPLLAEAAGQQRLAAAIACGLNAAFSAP